MSSSVRHPTPYPARIGNAERRDQVIAPILAGVHSPRPGRKPTRQTPVDRAYETLRIGMQDLFGHLGITTGAAAA